MPQGLQINNSNGEVILDITDRITRILVVDEFPYTDSFTKSYTFPEFESHSPFVICSSFNVITRVVDAVDVYLSGNPRPAEQCVWYQITWSINGSTLILQGNKSDFKTTGTFGTATLRTDRISQPPFKLIIGVY
ncbi:TPA: hypothetical protein MW161_000361 [Acinetobacter baumannii]|nr:hypothetical protein [Acinetobacter baumannii]HCA5022626.1 hypothetical protein [Acinetobacter baumannii]